MGQGSFGIVYKALTKDNDNVYALKWILYHGSNDGFPFVSLREIQALKKITHKNLVKLYDIVSSNGKDGIQEVFLILEFIDYDLSYFNVKFVFSDDEIRVILY